MTQATIDLATFEALKEAAGADFVLELVGTFLVEAPAMIGDLRSALAANDADRFRRAAHSLKSNSMTFGALTLGAMARSLELGGIGPVQQAGGEPLDRLADEYALVAQTLSELRNA
jgi:HPt (histidine-containing phosphotransfer) domain-containing protein